MSCAKLAVHVLAFRLEMKKMKCGTVRFLTARGVNFVVDMSRSSDEVVHSIQCFINGAMELILRIVKMKRPWWYSIMGITTFSYVYPQIRKRNICEPMLTPNLNACPALILKP
jgi:hypothetical protein